MSTIAIAFFFIFISASPSFEIILLCKTFKAEFQSPLNTSEGRHHDCRVDSQGQSWPLTKIKFFIFHVLRFLLEMQISSSYPRHEYMELHELTELTWRLLAATQLPSASPKPKIWLSVTLNCISVPPHPSFKGHKTRQEKNHLENRFFIARKMCTITNF